MIQRQNQITEMLVRQQSQSYLPKRNLLVLQGGSLTYRSFIRAFAHVIDSKAESSRDKLYNLEQLTRLEPQELVRSCEHMAPVGGYAMENF